MTAARVRLDERVGVLAPISAPDALGGHAVTFTEVGRVWAEVALETLAADAARDAVGSVRRFRTVVKEAPFPIAVGWALSWRGRRLAVRAVAVDASGLRRLVCEEEAS